jgi:putative permease
MNGHFTHRPLLKTLLILSILLTGFGVASFFPNVVADLIFSILTAFVLNPVVTFLESRFRIRKSLAAFLVIFFVAGTAVSAIYLLFPFAVKSISSMIDALRTFPFDQELNKKTKDLAESFPFINPAVVTEKTHAILQKGIHLLESGIETVAGFAATVVIVPFVAYFLIVDGDKAVNGFIELIPNKYFEMSLNVFYKIKVKLVDYFKGWLLECAIIGILSIAGLTILGVNHAVFIGIAAGFANLIPYFGPVVGASLAVIVSMTQTGNFSMLLPILLLTVLIRIIDDIAIQPLCYSASIDMHPAAVVLILLIGHELMGIAGLMLAMPIATILKTTAVETYWGLKHYQITSAT